MHQIGDTKLQYEGPYSVIKMRLSEQDYTLVFLPAPNAVYGACRLMQRRGVSAATLIFPFFHLTSSPALPDSEGLFIPVSGIESRKIIEAPNGQKRVSWKTTHRFSAKTANSLVLRESFSPLTPNAQLLNCPESLIDSFLVNPVNGLDKLDNILQISALGFLRGWILKDYTNAAMCTRDEEIEHVITEWVESVTSIP